MVLTSGLSWVKVCQCQITGGLVVSGAYLRVVMSESLSVSDH